MPPYIWQDKNKQCVIRRFFEYSDEHIEGLKENLAELRNKINEGNMKSLYFSLDHSLLTLTAAVQNIQSSLPKKNGHSILNAPSLKSVQSVPSLAPIYYTWCARNYIAHNYIEFVTTSGVLWCGGVELEVNDSSLSVNGIFLKPLEDFRRKEKTPSDGLVERPNMPLDEVATLSVAFWKNSYEFIQNNQREERYQFWELWDYHEKQDNK